MLPPFVIEWDEKTTMSSPKMQRRYDAKYIISWFGVFFPFCKHGYIFSVSTLILFKLLEF